MPDMFDRAAELEQIERDELLARRGAPSRETPFEIEGKRVCLDCFEPLPKKRLAANPHAVRCVACQTRLERRR